MIRIRQNEFVINYRILLPIVPCGFCLTDGSLLELWVIDEHFEVRCRVCGHDGPHADNEKIAVEFWNKTNVVGWQE